MPDFVTEDLASRSLCNYIVYDEQLANILDELNLHLAELKNHLTEQDRHLHEQDRCLRKLDSMINEIRQTERRNNNG